MGNLGNKGPSSVKEIIKLKCITFALLSCKITVLILSREYSTNSILKADRRYHQTVSALILRLPSRNIRKLMLMLLIKLLVLM